MGRGGGQGPEKLRFRALVDCIATGAKTVPDARHKDRAQMGIEDFYLSGFALFFLQDPSLLEFQRRFEDQIQSNNLRTVFGIQQIPSDTHMRDLLDRQPATFLQAVFSEYLRRLQRSKQLQRYEFLDEGYLLTLDGSEYFSARVCTANDACSDASRMVG